MTVKDIVPELSLIGAVIVTTPAFTFALTYVGLAEDDVVTTGELVANVVTVPAKDRLMLVVWLYVVPAVAA